MIEGRPKSERMHAGRERIGAILLARGEVSAGRLAQALEIQRAHGGKLGHILVRRGWCDPRAVAQAAADQAGVALIDPEAAPLDPSLASAEEIGLYVADRVAPWRRIGGRVVHVAADLEQAERALSARGAESGPPVVALAEPAALDRALAQAYGPQLAARAAEKAPFRVSARAPMPATQRAGLAALALVVVAGLLFAPAQAGPLLFLGLIALNALNAAARIAVLGVALRAPSDPEAPERPGVAQLAAVRSKPRITLLIPLLREPETMPTLLDALERIDWPRDLLDVKLILEQDDAATRDALERLGLPPFAAILVAPPGGPRTKPRALNFALDFAQGEIIGIYDAEDQPEPDQLRRVADILRASGPDVACVQCRLAYFNPRENWLTRCFTIEYAIWFDVLLRGFRHLGLPIPLGGTSVFFRADALRRLGGWDAHNVTEDADLGMRLARAGYRCEVCVSTTYEEANSRLGAWIRQRSRWLKGYMQTWLTHMRAPVRLARELGPLGFIGFQTIFLGALVAYFGLPLFWAIWGLALLGMGPAWLTDAPFGAMAAVAVVQLSGWLAMLAAAMIATARRGQSWLQLWIPTLVFYWPLGAAAAHLALAELFVAPYLWRKTQHGVGREAKTAQARAAARRSPATAAPRRRIEAAE